MTARYPDLQDPRESGLELLRAQYERAGNPHLAWGDVKPRQDRIIRLYGAGSVIIELRGEPSEISALATLICRAVKLGRAMMDELEPPLQSANAEESQPAKES